MRTRLKRYAKYALVALFVVYLGAVAYDITKPTENAPEQPKMAVAAPVVEQQPPTVEELLKLVNEERAKVGVKPLSLNKDMATTAQWKADDMFKRNYFSHWPETVDGVKNTEKYTVNLAMRKLLAANCVDSSENIREQGTYNTSEAALAGWKSSKPHYEAMIDSRYESTGIGISGDKIVQHFCDES